MVTGQLSSIIVKDFFMRKFNLKIYTYLQIINIKLSRHFIVLLERRRKANDIHICICSRLGLWILSQPEKGAMFLLRQFVPDCYMLHAIFLDFWNHLQISQMPPFKKLSFQISVLERLNKCKFYPKLAFGTFLEKDLPCLINFLFFFIWKVTLLKHTAF